MPVNMVLAPFPGDPVGTKYYLCFVFPDTFSPSLNKNPIEVPFRREGYPGRSHTDHWRTPPPRVSPRSAMSLTYAMV